MSRVLDIVYNIRMLKEEVPAKTVVLKVLRSLTLRFMHIVHSIVEAKSLNTLNVDELSSSLKSHKSLLHLVGEQEDDKASHVKCSPYGEHGGRGTGGRGQGSYRG